MNRPDTTNEVARLRESLDLYTDIINKQDDELITLREENANLKGTIRYIIENRRLQAKAFSQNADDFEEMLNGLAPAPEEASPDHFVDTNKMIPEWRELGEDEVIDYCRKWAAEHLAGHGKETFYARLGLLVDFATDLYRDEIQKLKEAK